MTQSPDDRHSKHADEALSELGLADVGDRESGSDPLSEAPLVDQLRFELEQAKDRVLRAQAESENYRRRLQREMQEELRFANQPLLVDVLPVLDNMERAIEAAQQASDASGLLTGFKMVHQLLLLTFEKHHCTRVPAEGLIFDPTLHQALVHMPSEMEAGRISHVNQHGYQLHGRVIRPAQVVVSSGPPTQ